MTEIEKWELSRKVGLFGLDDLRKLAPIGDLGYENGWYPPFFFVRNTFIRTINATEILSASITSNNIEGIGTMKKIIAANRYAATPISVFLTPDRSIPFPPFHRISHLILS